MLNILQINIRAHIVLFLWYLDELLRWQIEGGDDNNRT